MFDIRTKTKILTLRCDIRLGVKFINLFDRTSRRNPNCWAKMGWSHEKTEGQKSRDTLPLKYINYNT